MIEGLSYKPYSRSVQTAQRCCFEKERYSAFEPNDVIRHDVISPETLFMSYETTYDIKSCEKMSYITTYDIKRLEFIEYVTEYDIKSLEMISYVTACDVKSLEKMSYVVAYDIFSRLFICILILGV